MASIFQELAAVETNRLSVVICTIIKSQGSTPRRVGSKMLVYPDGHISGTVGGGEVESRVIKEALDAYCEGKPRIVTYKLVSLEEGDPGVCGGQVEVYIEPVNPRPVLLIIGGGHVGKALAHLAAWLGFRVILSDDRAELCTPEANPDVEEFVVSPISDVINHVNITPQTSIVLTTRGTSVDVEGLPKLLDTPAAYIGVIGSRRRWEMTKRTLIENGISETQIDRVHSPIGLDINVETPEEIAVSIIAEIMLLTKGGTGQSKRI